MHKPETCPKCGSVIADVDLSSRRQFITYCCAGCPWGFPDSFVDPDKLSDDLMGLTDPSDVRYEEMDSEATIAVIIELMLIRLRRNVAPPDEPSPLLPIEHLFLPAESLAHALDRVALQAAERVPGLARKLSFLSLSVNQAKGNVGLVVGRGPDLLVETLSLTNARGAVITRITVCKGSRSAVQAHLFRRREALSSWVHESVFAVMNPDLIDGSPLEFVSEIHQVTEASSLWTGESSPAFLASTSKTSKNHSTGGDPIYLLYVVVYDESALLNSRAATLVSWSRRGEAHMTSPNAGPYRLWMGAVGCTLFSDFGKASRSALIDSAAAILLSLAPGTPGADSIRSRICPLICEAARGAEISLMECENGKDRIVIVSTSKRSWMYDKSGVRILGDTHLSFGQRQVSCTANKALVLFLTGGVSTLVSPETSPEANLKHVEAIVGPEISISTELGKLMRRMTVGPYTNWTARQSVLSTVVLPPVLWPSNHFRQGRLVVDIHKMRNHRLHIVVAEAHSPRIEIEGSSFLSGVVSQRPEITVECLSVQLARLSEITPTLYVDELPDWSDPRVVTIACALAAGYIAGGAMITMTPGGGQDPNKRLNALLFLARALGICRIVDPKEAEYPIGRWADNRCPVTISYSPLTHAIRTNSVIFCIPGADTAQANRMSQSFSRGDLDADSARMRFASGPMSIPAASAAILGATLFKSVPPWELVDRFRGSADGWRFSFSGKTYSERILESLLNGEVRYSWVEGYDLRIPMVSRENLQFEVSVATQQGLLTRALTQAGAAVQEASAHFMKEFPEMIALPASLQFPH